MNDSAPIHLALSKAPEHGRRGNRRLSCAHTRFPNRLLKDAQYCTGPGFGSSGLARIWLIRSIALDFSYRIPGKMMIDAVPELGFGRGFAVFCGVKVRSMPIRGTPLGNRSLYATPPSL